MVAKGETSTFRSIFFGQQATVPIGVPDYQRAYSWEQKQIDLFITDLIKYEGKSGYYFGHFIVEEDEDRWEVVDGQQRLTTFVLFLMICRHLSPGLDHAANAMIGRFETVSYDASALQDISARLVILLQDLETTDGKKLPSDDRIRKAMESPTAFTRSQGRMVRALFRFHQAFRRGELEQDKAARYIDVVMNAHASLHLTRDKSVAVNIFEMHNTRGVPLSTLEIVKAKLMQFVHDHGGADRRNKVEEIQKEFGEIYAMEEGLAERSFRGEMTMEQLLRLHLRVVDDGIDDGKKMNATSFVTPPLNADSNALVDYVQKGLRFADDNKTTHKSDEEGVSYAVNLARELKKSVRIVSTVLPKWDENEPLVGDVLIMERELSCQFFLITCRLFENAKGHADGRLSHKALSLWEKFLFTRDFHDRYYNLKGSRDRFEELYQNCCEDKDKVCETLAAYLKNGFRHWDRTAGLQGIVREYLRVHKKEILRGAYGWWSHKMLYVIYKYEVSQASDVRKIVKSSPSLEHILPQNWQWSWIEEEDVPPKPKIEHAGGRENALKQINSYVNGLGNLILLTGSENSAQGNRHPKVKRYLRHQGRSYDWHHDNLDNWSSSSKWFGLIMRRGLEIYRFMIESLICESDEKSGVIEKPPSNPNE